MQHRDYIIIKKILSEIEIGYQLLGNMSLEEIMNNEIDEKLCEKWNKKNME